VLFPVLSILWASLVLILSKYVSLFDCLIMNLPSVAEFPHAPPPKAIDRMPPIISADKISDYGSSAGTAIGRSGKKKHSDYPPVSNDKKEDSSGSPFSSEESNKSDESITHRERMLSTSGQQFITIGSAVGEI